CESGGGRGPVGDRRLRAGVAAESACGGRRCAGGGTRRAGRRCGRAMTELARDAELARLQRLALVLGGAALAASAARAAVEAGDFLRAWLVSYVFWLGIPLGCLAIIQLHYLAGGAWGIVIRRLAEAASGPLPLLALLFVPIAVGMPRLFVWARLGAVAAAADLRE